MTFRKSGGRKRVVTPDGSEWAPRPQIDNAMVKALARAFRWRKQLDEGVHATLDDLARAKGVNATYVSRVLRLTLLAPKIVEAILDGRQPADVPLDNLLKGFPLDWKKQHLHFLGGSALLAAHLGRHHAASRAERTVGVAQPKPHKRVLHSVSPVTRSILVAFANGALPADAQPPQLAPEVVETIDTGRETAAGSAVG
jgi:hypothetical protein